MLSNALLGRRCTPHVSQVYGFALFGLDMPSALLCLARCCTPDMVGGVVILPSMSHLVGNHHHHHLLFDCQTTAG
jgi:hypothetical protein